MSKLAAVACAFAVVDAADTKVFKMTHHSDAGCTTAVDTKFVRYYKKDVCYPAGDYDLDFIKATLTDSAFTLKKYAAKGCSGDGADLDDGNGLKCADKNSKSGKFETADLDLAKAVEVSEWLKVRRQKQQVGQVRDCRFRPG